MKFKSFRVITFSFLALTIGYFAKTSVGHADGVLQAIRVIPDEYYVQDRDKYCGKWDDTSKACNSDYLACYEAFERIVDNMYDVCKERSQVCD